MGKNLHINRSGMTPNKKKKPKTATKKITQNQPTKANIIQQLDLFHDLKQTNKI